MTLGDGAGLAGVALTLAAYAAATRGKLDPRHAVALSANLIGSGLILFSLLTEKFNLAATAMEGAWGLVALSGLVRLAVRRLREPRGR
jgi:hypothetical protein